MLEEKKIPYRMEKINMRSYGDKPKSFLNKVPSGLLPVIELDGRVITESAEIMMILEEVSIILSKQNRLNTLADMRFNGSCHYLYRQKRSMFCASIK
jgi:glutathione S-transferase